MTTQDITWQETLSAAEIGALDGLLDRVQHDDGISALSEHTYLHLRSGGGPGQRHLLAREGSQIVGYGFLDSDGSGEFLVHPAARGHGLGGRLLSVLRGAAGRDLRLWAHGDLPAARALAESADMVAVRRLCRYTRPLADLPERPLPPGITVRTFTPADAAAWLELNAAAFTDLPDQGSWTSVDLERRTRQSWFDPRGFLLAFDAEGLAGAHWTKVHGGGAHGHSPIGEVYVLAVAPRTRGTGLGAALTIAGLQHLRAEGLEEVMLYVDSSNGAAVGLYTRLGFICADCDVQYAHPRI